ncbi:MAG: hypothetical protein JST11_15925 [Acidobacteria bacterium]|nr:hypothetical protein [Acidobacteriota bacterium]
MAPFDELQLLWQSQRTRPAQVDPAALAGEFRRYGRRQDIVNSVKAVLLAGVLVNVVVTMRHRPPILFALLSILAAAVLALISEWRNQRAIGALDLSAPSVEFVRGAIARLQRQRNPFHTREFAVLFAAVCLGYNLMVLDRYDRWPLAERILGHVFSVLLPASIYVVGRLVRAGRWNSECRPLMLRLRSLLETLEEDRGR